MTLSAPSAFIGHGKLASQAAGEFATEVEAHLRKCLNEQFDGKTQYKRRYSDHDQGNPVLVDPEKFSRVNDGCNAASERGGCPDGQKNVFKPIGVWVFVGRIVAVEFKTHAWGL
jgi:hypothetical protein